VGKYFHEITPLTPSDSFLIMNREKEDFEFPIHYHEEIELNYISNAEGAQRIVGESIEDISDKELVLVGSNLVHGWRQNNASLEGVNEITVQFHQDLFGKEFLERSIMKPIRDMLYRSQRGILFSYDISENIGARLLKISKIDGIDYFLEMISLLHDLAVSRNQRLLSVTNPDISNFEVDTRLKTLHDYVQSNYTLDITLDQVAKYMNMSVVSFNRFIKKRTSKTFIQYLQDIRIGYASRWLIEKELNIAEIAYNSGFNNITHFNRSFKKIKGCTPTQYRKDFRGIRKAL